MKTLSATLHPTHGYQLFNGKDLLFTGGDSIFTNVYEEIVRRVNAGRTEDAALAATRAEIVNRAMSYPLDEVTA